LRRKWNKSRWKWQDKHGSSQGESGMSQNKNGTRQDENGTSQGKNSTIRDENGMSQDENWTNQDENGISLKIGPPNTSWVTLSPLPPHAF